MTHSACRDGAMRGATAGAVEVCGLQTQICSNCWIRGLRANGFFLFRGRDVAITMNSVEILHAVRAAITAIAELLVVIIIITTYRHCWNNVSKAL